MSNQHPCARCASVQKTCCQRAEIVVTTGDLARIAAHTGHADVAHRTRPTDPSYLEHDPDDPNWTAYTIAPDGTRRVLKKQDGVHAGLSGHRGQAGDCAFLGPAGCALPEEVRPLVCRLYPFMYTERGLDGEADESEGVDESYCPTHLFFTAQERRPTDGRPRVTMLTVLKMDPRDAERWRRQLYDELRADHDAQA